MVPTYALSCLHTAIPVPSFCGFGHSHTCIPPYFAFFDSYDSYYSYDATVEDNDGTLKMHREVTSAGVKDYASHVPGENVALSKKEDIEYKRGVLTQSKGTTRTKLVPQVR